MRTAPGGSPLLIATIARERGTTGVHTHVRQLLGHVARTGHPAEVVTPHSWGGRLGRLLLFPLFGVRPVLQRLSGPAHVWWYRTSHELFLRRELRRRLADGHACTVYAQCPVSARAALAARRGPHQRVVLAVHFRTSQADEWANKGEIPPGGRVFGWIRATERGVLPRVDGLVFVSAWARDAVQAWLPEIDHVPGRVIPNFLDAPRAHDEAPVPGRLVTVGSLEPVKNHRFLLRVLAEAAASGHRFTLDVYGEGPERSRLLSLAEVLGVGHQVVLHGFCDDVRERLPGHSAYVHASYSESSSLAIMEAMAVGLPVVSSAVDALTEVFDAPEEGRYWPLDDVEEAARVLVDLMTSPSELERVGTAAQERFLRDYDVRVVAPRLLGFLVPGTVEALSVEGTSGRPGTDDAGAPARPAPRSRPAGASGSAVGAGHGGGTRWWGSR